MKFLVEAFRELKRTEWPSLVLTRNLTYVVLATIVLSTLALWAVDSLLLSLVKRLLGASF